MVYSEGLKVHVKSNSNDFCAFEHYNKFIRTTWLEKLVWVVEFRIGTKQC